MNKNQKFILVSVLFAFNLLLISSSLNLDKNNNLINTPMPDMEKENQIQISDKVTTVDYNFTEIWTNVSNSPSTNSHNARSAIDSDNNVHFVWQEFESGANDSIRYCFFNYTSRLFEGLLTISLTNRFNEDPDICIDPSNNIHVTWTAQHPGESSNIYYRKYDASGSSWDSILTAASYQTKTEFAPRIACNSTGGVAIIYATSPIYLNNKQNVTFFDGSTWTNVPITPDENVADQENGHIFCYNDNWHLVYVNYSESDSFRYVIYQNQTSWGSWNAPDIVRSAGAVTVRYPEVNIRNDHMFVTWQEGGTFFIFSKNRSLTQSWPAGHNDLTGSTGFGGSDQIYSVGLTSTNDLYLAYQNTTGIGYKKFTPSVEHQNHVTIDTFGRTPDLVIDSVGSVFFSWHNNSPGEIHMRKLDDYGPQLNVYNLLNDTSYEGIIQLDSSVYMYDIDSINYTYYVDTDEDGIANDGNNWQNIHYWDSSQNPTLFNYTWNTNESSNRLDFLNILISVKAVDENGLDEEIIFGNITFDNHKPQISSLLEIYDEYGHNSSNGDSNFTYADGGAIHFVFAASDNNSLEDTIVTLYNNDTGALKVNASATEIVITQADISNWNGIFDFYINTTDNADNFNVSNTITNIRIDNNKPVVNISYLLENLEIKNGYLIGMNETNSDDILYVNYTYYTTNPDVQTYLGTYNFPSGSWTYPINILPNAHTDITFVVNATDYTDLYGWDTMEMTIDNLAPTPELVGELLEIGIKPILNISFAMNLTDNDTAEAAVYYREFLPGSGGTGTFIDAENRSVDVSNLGGDDSTNGTDFFIIFDEIDLQSLPVLWTHVEIRVWAKDNQDLIGELILSGNDGIDIKRETPNKTTSFSGTLDGYTVNLTWEAVPTAEYYLVYRSYNKFNLDRTNDWTGFQRLYNLGNDVGVKFCIAKINASQTHVVDNLTGPNTYYYLVLAVNQHGNPSEAVAYTVLVIAENHAKTVLGNISFIWIFFFGGYVGIMIGITFYGRRRIKKTFTKGRIKLHVEKIKEDIAAKFEGEEEDIELDSKVRKDVQFISPTSEKVGRWADQASIIEEKAASFDEDREPPKAVKIEKCPTCQWILSSTAKKCPRCGWRRLE